MGFKDWLAVEGMKELARAYTDALKDVPQNVEHHPEGSVLNHSRLVRKAILFAAKSLEDKKSDPVLGPILSDLDFRLSENDLTVLGLAAYLHDIGKATATTVDDVPFRAATGHGKVRSIGHERPEHYGPQVDRLMAVAPKGVAAAYESNRDLIQFLIEHHMDLTSGGFPKSIIMSYFDSGKVKNERPIRLLLVLMWADQIGRAKAPNLAKNIAGILDASKKSLKASKRSAPFSGSEDEFRAMLKARGLDQGSIDAAARAKFG
jgi:hypothetical protein